MRISLVIVSLLFILGCNYAYLPSDKELIVNRILKESSVKIEKETGLIPFGSGGQMLGQIKMLNLGFLHHQSISIDEGRKLVLFCAHVMLHQINSNSKVRPFLDKFPFQAKNLEIQIYIQNRQGYPFGKDALTVVDLSKGIIKYQTSDRENRRLITIFKETYEEALDRADLSSESIAI